MSTVKLNFRTANEVAGWNNFTAAQAKAGTAAFVNTDSVNTGWSLNYIPSDVPTNSTSMGTEYFPDGGVGDAAWVDSSIVLRQGHQFNPTGGDMVFSGLDNSKVYSFSVFGSTDISGRVVGLSVFDGVEQTLAMTNNNSEVLVFEDVIPQGGQIIFTMRAVSGDWAGVNAMLMTEAEPEIENPVVPFALVDQSTLTFGDTLTGTYSGFAQTPTTLTLTDSADNSVELDITVDTEAGTFTGTLPSLPNVDAGFQFLRFGAITATLSNDNDESDTDTFTFNAGAGYAVTVLEDPVDGYLFEEWDNPPLAGFILFNESENGGFDVNGNLIPATEDPFQYWMIDDTGYVSSATVDPSQLETFDGTPTGEFTVDVSDITPTAFTFTASWVGDDVTTTEYRIDGGEWMEFTQAEPVVISDLSPVTSYTLDLRAYGELEDWSDIAAESVTTLEEEPIDSTPPVITLTGGNPTIDVGTNWVELGYTAIDNIDGDITGNVVVTGTVNSSVVGEYTLTYSVSDVAGNSVQVNRIVTVALPTYSRTYERAPRSRSVRFERLKTSEISKISEEVIDIDVDLQRFLTTNSDELSDYTAEIEGNGYEIVDHQNMSDDNGVWIKVWVSGGIGGGVITLIINTEGGRTLVGKISVKTV
jgi:hypothetical protein